MNATQAVARALSDAFEFTEDEALDLARVAAPVAANHLGGLILTSTCDSELCSHLCCAGKRLCVELIRTAL